jgi:hypothetical protein
LPDVALKNGIHLWFVHDGTAPHFHLAFWVFFKNLFLEQWWDDVDKHTGLLVDEHTGLLVSLI